MSHIKTLDRVYYCKHENRQFTEDAAGYIKTVEYTTENGIKGRYLIIDNHNDFENNRCALTFKHQVKEEAEWITSAVVDNVIADAFTYCNDSGITVTEAEATELVDDLANEILDYTDPNNPVSFDPKQYIKKKQTKAGYHKKIDYYMNSLSPLIFPTFETLLINKFNITT